MPRVPTVLHTPGFRNVWVASLASNCGSWLQVIAAGWMVLVLTDSPAAVGALAFAARGPAFVLSTLGGQLADRFDRRWVGMATFALQGLAAAGMAVLSWAGALTTPLIFVLTFALGVGFALGLPAMLVLIPELVPPPQLPQAVALNAAGINVARLAGPAIGGVLFDTAGPTWCFAVNSLSFVALIVALAYARPRTTDRAARGAAGMRRALGVAWRDPAIRRLLVGMTVFATCASPIQELAPVVADRLDAGPRGLGFLLGAMGTGALVGTWVLAQLRRAGVPRSTTLPSAITASAAGMAVLAVSGHLPLSLAAMGFCGVFWIWMFIDTNTAIQLRAPTAMVGRLLGLYQLAVVAPIAVGAASAGLIADVWGMRAGLLTGAVGLAAFGVWGLVRREPLIDAGRLEAGG